MVVGAHDVRLRDHDFLHGVADGFLKRPAGLVAQRGSGLGLDGLVEVAVEGVCGGTSVEGELEFLQYDNA